MLDDEFASPAQAPTLAFVITEAELAAAEPLSPAFAPGSGGGISISAKLADS